MAREWTLDEVRDDVLARVRKFYNADIAMTCGQLIDALVAWSRAAGLERVRHFGDSPVLKFRPSRGSSEAWAIYSEDREGKGPKLCLVPGRRDHGQRLRAATERLTDAPQGGWDGRKLGITLADIAVMPSWAPVFEAVELAVEHAQQSRQVVARSIP